MVDLTAEEALFMTPPPALDLQELQTMLLHIPGGVVIADAPSGKVIYQNAEAASLLRHPLLHEGNYQQYCHGALHADGRRYGHSEYPIARALEGEVVKQEEVLYRRGDGRLRYFLVNAVPIYRPDGSIARVMATFFDISGRRDREKNLQDSGRRMQWAVDGAAVALWTINVANGDALVDERMQQVLGYLPGDIKGSFNAWLSLVHADDKQHLLDQWHDHLEKKRALFAPVARFRTKQGGWKWLQVRGGVVECDDDGSARRAAGVLFDVDEARNAELMMHEREERLRITLNQAAIGIATLAPDGRWLGLNPKLSDILGYPPQTLLEAGTLQQIVHADDGPQFARLWEALLHSELPSFSLELRVIRQDGAVLWADCTVSAVTDDLGRVQCAVAVMQDITTKKLAQQQMRKLQKQLVIATKIARLGFWEWSPASNEIYFSPEWKAQLGWRDDELANRWDEWETRVHPDDLPRVKNRIDGFLAAPTAEFFEELRMRHRDGSYRWINVRGLPMFDAHNRIDKLVGIHLDITEQKLAQENIRQAAQHDALTGLPNRSLLLEFAGHLLATARRNAAPLAVLFFDLDRFKAVNDTHGHKVGDGVLKEVAARLTRVLRAEDVVGRLGGDEFVAVLPRIGGKQGAATAAAKALAALNQPYLIDQIELQLSPSIGISMFPADGEQIETLIQQADAAMYEVKHSGRNHYRFADSHAAQRSASTDDLAGRLHSALERDEFALHYQPVVDTRNGAVTSVEALLRWPQQDIAPNAFLPVLEASGLMGRLGLWILQEACRQHVQWQAQGLPPMTIAVNVSASQLQQRDFERNVDTVLAASQDEPAWLEIAVAESTVTNNFDAVAATLQTLKEHGALIALEDVGSGLSNPAQLSRLPIDKLKVDQAYLRQLGDDRSALAIADVVMALGHALGVEVVAEGIESEQDLALWRAHDCHQAQGFHLCRPMSAPHFVEWYRQHAATLH